MKFWLKLGLIISILLVVGFVILDGLKNIHGVKYVWKLPDFTQSGLITFYIVGLLNVFFVGLHGGVAVYGIVRFIKFLRERKLFTGNIELPFWKKGASIGFFLSCLINFLIVLIFGFYFKFLNVIGSRVACGHYGCGSDYILAFYMVFIVISDLVFALLSSLVGFLFGLTVKYKK